MSFLFWGRRDPNNKQAAAAPSPLPPQEKLKGYYDITKEALERAIEAERCGETAKALSLYSTVLTAAKEGLAVPVQGTGLGPRADNISSWKHDLQAWSQLVQDRLRVLESGGASTSSTIPSLHAHRNTAPGGGAGSSFKGAPLASGASHLATGSRRTTRGSNGGGAAAGVRPASAPVVRAGGGGGGGGLVTATGSGRGAGPKGSSSESSKEDERLRELVLREMLEAAPPVSWDDIAGLPTAKQALIEAVVLPTLRSDIFQGLRSPIRGILLYGPPGNGKTLLGRALAHEAKAAFFSISASSLTSKFVGEGEKLMRTLFEEATRRQPAIIFIDEVDSLLSARSANEHDAMRRLKTEFLVQFDGVTGGADRVIVIGATNRPAELDDAARRRLVKRIYVPLPDEAGRRSVLEKLLSKGVTAKLSAADVDKIVRATAGYSGSDLTALCKEAAMGPVRELGPRIASVAIGQIRPVLLHDFGAALTVIKPSVNRAMLQAYEEFTKEYGTT